MMESMLHPIDTFFFVQSARVFDDLVDTSNERRDVAV